MKINRSHFTFDRSKRNGILSLVGTILLLIGFKIYLRSIAGTPVLDPDTPEVVALRNQLDSLKRLHADSSRSNRFPFNPNFLSEFKAYTLGLSASEYNQLKSYREAGNWINSAEDFQRVTGVSDSLLSEIKKDFKFPDWTTRTKINVKPFRPLFEALPEDKKIDLNAATADALREIPGIGKVLSQRIIDYRERLGGFSTEDQLFAIYGLRQEVIEKVKMRFTVKTPVEIRRYNINTASASDIATLPGISFELAIEIWEFVRLREGIESLDELTKIEEITPSRLQLIKVYLWVE